MARGVPVNLVDSGGVPVTNLAAEGAEPYTVTDVPAMPVTLVLAGGYPVTLLNEDGSLYGITLSAVTVAENAANGSTIGNLAVNGGVGSYTFTIDQDPDSKFSITGAALKKNAAMNYEAATSHLVRIKADNGDGDIRFQWFTIEVTNVAEKPVNLTLPVITGTPTVDQALSCSTGTWTDASFPTTYAYQWYADDAAIDGATASTYLLTEDEEGTDITCGVVATNSADDSDEAVSVSVGPVAAAPDVTAPTVSSRSPADNATSVAVDGDLVATFNETVSLGASGSIYLKKTSDNSTVDSWNVASDGGSGAGQVEIVGGDDLTLHLSADLDHEIEYYVVWDAGVVKDASNNPVAALSSTTAWSFTSAAAAPAGYDIILTTGDSNKFSGASFDGGLDVVDADVKQLGYTSPNTDAVIAALDPMDYAPDGVTADKIGHDQHFAKDYYKGNGHLLGARKALIVTNAKGGSAAGGAQSGGSWCPATGTPGAPTTGGTDLLDTASARLTTALALPDTNTVVAVLDCEGVNAYASYGNTVELSQIGKYRWALHRKYQYLRNLVGPTVPIIITRQTKDAINAAGGDFSTNGVIVDNIIKSMARRFPYFAVADSQSPTELGGDGVSGEVHFTAAEQRTLAGRYYTAYLAALANTGRGTVTWEPDDVRTQALGYNAGFALSNGNLDLSGDANSDWKTHTASAPVRSGKVYCEVKIQAMASGVNLGFLGFCNADRMLSDTNAPNATSSNDGPADMIAGIWGGHDGTNAAIGYTQDQSGALTWVLNDIIMLAVDMAAGKAWIGKNGTWSFSGNPAAGTGSWISGIVDPIYIAATIYTGAGNTYRLQPNAASFIHSPPSGFSAWGA